jgi:hypothetical protein
VTVEFIDEAIAVETQLRHDGTARPVAFMWRGRRFAVASWGRESARMRKGRACRCHLVQTPDLTSWELCQDAETGGWTLTRFWARGPHAI